MCRTQTTTRNHLSYKSCFSSPSQRPPLWGGIFLCIGACVPGTARPVFWTAADVAPRIMHNAKAISGQSPALIDAVLGVERSRHLPPGLLVAVAIVESGMQPTALGAAGELSMFQIMPVLRNGNVTPFGKSRYATDASWRERCHSRPDRCQTGPAYYASQLLLAGRSRCGSWTGALSAYNSGSCTARLDTYAWRVIGVIEQLRK